MRIRKEDQEYYLTYKSKGLLAREEYNLPLTEDAYRHLLKKADGIVLTKRRYLIPIPDTDLTVELDEFSGEYKGLFLAEVEFETMDMAENFIPPSWFGTDVTLPEQQIVLIKKALISFYIYTCQRTGRGGPSAIPHIERKNTAP